MRVAFVTSEVTPFSKTGGLADVSEALPVALAQLGLDVTVFTPLYRGAAATLTRLGLSGEEHTGPPLWIGDQQHATRYRTVMRDGCRYVFVVNDYFYHRPGLYLDEHGAEYGDTVGRFAFFCRAVLEHELASKQAPAVFHLNDWQSALIPIYLDTLYRRTVLAASRTVLTVHNLGFQGLRPAAEIYATGLDWSVFNVNGLEFYGRLSLLKGGLMYADALTTVSPTYAEEIQRPEFGHGLDGVLRSVRGKLTGILNGVDTARWDPATDPHLPAHYDANHLDDKARCTAALLERMRLPTLPNGFVYGTVSRLDAQKGLPLIVDALDIVAPLPIQVVVLGSGDPALEARLRALAARRPRQVAVTIGFDEGLAHLIEAGADAFLMPSAYEPCGLNQMYSQRYGTPPIVHATGGLKDTVIDYRPERLVRGSASGFSFATFDAAHLAESMLRAWWLRTDDPRAWRKLQRHCMGLDHSWTRSAQAYKELYERVGT